MKNRNNSITFQHSAQTIQSGIFSLLILLTALFTSETLFAQGSLLLTPKRVIFEGKKNSEIINLANLGNDTAQYIISLVEYRMKEDGAFEEITQLDNGQFSAAPFLRYFPRTVTLAPNEAQVIRLQLDKKAGQISSGEYRSHLYVRAVPKITALGDSDVNQAEGIGVKLVPIFGISIPVIIRVGESVANLTISKLSISKSEDLNSLNMTLNRSGKMSIYGDIVVTHIANNGKSTQVGIIKGLAVYAPNELRQVKLPLNKDLQVNYHSGKLVTRFNSNVDGKDKKMVESELALK
jgi:P pilus assembly chaperone PapD